VGGHFVLCDEDNQVLSFISMAPNLKLLCFSLGF